MDIKISIITPSFNPGELILETFESLKKQTFQDFEWIIVDDCSDVSHHAFYEQIKKESPFEVRIELNKINQGQASCKNQGASLASGKYLRFLDADDLLEAGLQARQYELIQQQPEIIPITPTKYLRVQDGQEKTWINESIYNIDFEGDLLKQYLKRTFFTHCSCLFPRKVFDSVAGFDESLCTDEDGDFLIRLLIEGHRLLLDDSFFFIYRSHQQTRRVSGNDSPEKWADRIKVCKKTSDALSIKDQVEPYRKLLAKKLSYIREECKSVYPSLAKDAKMLMQEIDPNFNFFGNAIFHGLKRLKRKL